MPNKIEKLFGSALYSGYMPFASGTWGSIVATIIFFIPGFENIYVILPLTVILFFWGIRIGDKFERQYGKDPSQLTLDEVVGTWITYLFLPKDIIIIGIAFVLWRILDIIKPPPARQAENLNGGLGIMLDDVISGFYSFIIMHIALFLLNR
ncbi:MAG: phosphatidylglycerophosphatase A [Melioribacteraceae bacterium]|nr:MAG: phosphatidylglycerophosphatase A [Melioribacteraceae bacterium]